MKGAILVVAYLVSIVAANLSVSYLGAGVSILTSLVLIALDLTARDTLHEIWGEKHLWRNMLILIGAGSGLSALVNHNATPIAIASFAAFLLSGISDTLVYQLLGKSSKLLKMNGSNLISAAVDSVVFPLIAFGWPPLFGIMAGNYIAKVVGGALWSVLLIRWQDPNKGFKDMV